MLKWFSLNVKKLQDPCRIYGGAYHFYILNLQCMVIEKYCRGGSVSKLNEKITKPCMFTGVIYRKYLLVLHFCFEKYNYKPNVIQYLNGQIVFPYHNFDILI